MIDYQSAYRKFHSTEYALLKIHNDILSSVDDGKVTALTLLDLYAAFDTIDHTILLRRLGNRFGMSRKALDWFKSYLTGIGQRIKLGNCLSSKSDLSFGVPQGQFLVLCFLRGKQPVYLHSMLAASIPSRSLRSINDHILSVHRVKTNTGARAFHSCAPSLWNNLPLSVQFTCYL